MSRTSILQLPLPFADETFEIPLTKGYTTLVDAIDADLIKHGWNALELRNNRVYAQRTIKLDGKQYGCYLHRVIVERALGRPLLSSEEVDHQDRNTLNNRRGNLRASTRAQNAHNTLKNSNNTSGFKGVCFYKASGKFKANITLNSRNKHLGYFDTPEEAHKAYCEAAEKYYGEFANPG